MRIVCDNGCTFTGETQDHRRLILYEWINSYMLHQHLQHIHDNPDAIDVDDVNILLKVSIDIDD